MSGLEVASCYAMQSLTFGPICMCLCLLHSISFAHLSVGTQRASCYFSSLGSAKALQRVKCLCFFSCHIPLIPKSTFSVVYYCIARLCPSLLPVQWPPSIQARLRVHCVSPLPGPPLTTGVRQTAGMSLLHTGHQLPSGRVMVETPLLIERCSLNSYRSFTMKESLCDKCVCSLNWQKSNKWLSRFKLLIEMIKL